MQASSTKVKNVIVEGAEDIPQRLWPHLHRIMDQYLSLYQLITRNFDHLLSIRAVLKHDDMRKWTDISAVFVTSAEEKGPRKGVRRTFRLELGGWSDELSEELNK